jgi:hypothetical protein
MGDKLRCMFLQALSCLYHSVNLCMGDELWCMFLQALLCLYHSVNFCMGDELWCIFLQALLCLCRSANPCLRHTQYILVPILQRLYFLAVPCIGYELLCNLLQVLFCLHHSVVIHTTTSIVTICASWGSLVWVMNVNKLLCISYQCNRWNRLKCIFLRSAQVYPVSTWSRAFRVRKVQTLAHIYPLATLYSKGHWLISPQVGRVLYAGTNRRFKSVTGGSRLNNGRYTNTWIWIN